MKKRTIEDIHDRNIGHRKFAWFVDTAIGKGYQITDIKEYYGKYKFRMNGLELEFDKTPTINAKWQLNMCETLVKQNEQLRALSK